MNKLEQHILLDDSDAFRFLIYWVVLEKKIFKERYPLRPIWPRPSPAPEVIKLKWTILVGDLEYFMHTKFHQNPQSGFEEEVQNVQKSPPPFLKMCMND